MLVFGTASVEAAILSNSQGQVTVQTSQGPRTVAGSFEVAQGDVVTTGPDGSVVLNFASGCYQTLGPNERVIVDEAVCAAGGVSTSGIQQSIVADPGFVFGGMAAIGLTGGLILSNRNRDTPGSP